MKILVDADSCPAQARALILRSSAKRNIQAIFAANRLIPGIALADGDSSPLAVMELCPPGEGSADNRIVELAAAGDLAVTRDVPLAERLVEKGISVLDDRGRIYTAENIRELRSLRDFMVDLARSGLGMERSPAYGKRELKAFADSFDKELTRLNKA
ncbi:DUF188 domain-containing protein [Leadbettera azotonutricia]|uniref:UPF0178 protein TREAZ_0924 n=1 Tax=Leadbettera azotonutricia (strain ATCC BAA-888 / DSM 13862 / ZAS-9) TaxID=545695 RepID=F5Y8W0_LEAAZ|nr:DUF188 domain-containing protein [Leadbettera azotonutricia]AEF81137.1 YaiI/YqxD family protein [Leadbettera azotonutricia ZAS-9]